MASQTQANYSCPICYEIFRDPVLLSCTHSFCEACWQRCWTEDRAHKCPVCRTRSWQSDPPRNLALKAVCEDFLAVRAQRASGGAEPLCFMHAETLKLFCLDDRQPVCVVCMHSEIHTNHSVRPIDEAARDYKCGLQYSLDDLREKLELFNDVKRNFDQTENDIELQNTDTERQIKEEPQRRHWELKISVSYKTTRPQLIESTNPSLMSQSQSQFCKTQPNTSTTCPLSS